MSLRMRDYRVIAAGKQTERNKKIPPQWLIDSALRNATSVLHIPVTCGVLSDVECDITLKFDATTLLKKLKEGAWSAEQVNCLTEIFFDEAIERARHLDKERKENPSNVLPPLWGLPISLKDSFDILGHDSSTGLACYVGEPAEENSSLAAMLLDLGAVLYCKTNVSQLTIPADSDNNVFGRTVNPRNPNLTAGGSTGGEAALIALRGSILGVGTDIGGSIRVPAVCNGIYGLKTSVGLIPHDGVRNLSVPGADGVRSSVGPMATSIRDCALFLRTVMESETWRYDSTIISLPWRNLPVKKKLRIGLVEDDGIYTPSPPVRRGLKKAADLLQNNGEIELVPITLPNTKEHYNALLRYFSYPGSDHYREQLARTGEPEVPSLKAIQLLNFQGTSLEGLCDLNVHRAAAAKQYQRLFLDYGIDAILMPPAPHTAVPLDHWTTASYTGLWNYLDFPAVVIPVDYVAASDALDKTTTAKYGPDDAKVYSLYAGPELYRDTSVSIQLVGYRHADEALSNAAILIDSIINTPTGK